MGKPECPGEKPISQTKLIRNKNGPKGENVKGILGLRKKDNKNIHKSTHAKKKEKKKKVYERKCTWLIGTENERLVKQ